MIIEWFISIGTHISDWAVGLFGTADAPAYLTTIASFVNGLMTSAAGLGAWVPWAFVIVVAGINLALWGVGLGVKAVRWIIGLIPTMGGG